MVRFVVLFALLWATCANAVTNLGGVTATDEVRRQLSTLSGPYVYSGCLPAIPGSGLTIAAFACTAFVEDGSTPAALNPVVQAALALTLPNSATVWVAAVSTETGSAPAGWTRESAKRTHYVYQATGSQPANPTSGLVVLKVTVSGGNIATITNVAPRVLTESTTIANNTTVAGSIVRLPGGSFSVDSGKTLTIACNKILADDTTLFTGSGTTTCSDQPSAGIPASWFGVVADDSTDNTAALQNALNQGGRILLPVNSALAMRITDEVQITQIGTHLIGGGMNGSIIRVVGTVGGIVVSANECEIAALAITDNGAVASLDGIIMHNGGLCDIHDVLVTSMGRDGVRFDNSYTTPAGNNNRAVIRNSYFTNNGRYGVAIPALQSDNNIISFIDNSYLLNTQHGLLIVGHGNIVRGGDVEGNGACGIQVGINTGTEATGNTVEEPWVESNTGGGICTGTKSLKTLIKHNGVSGQDVVTISGEDGSEERNNDAGLIRTFVGKELQVSRLKLTSANNIELKKGVPSVLPGNENVVLFVDDSADYSGGGGNDCALVARLQSGANVLVTTLVLNGGCPP